MKKVKRPSATDRITETVAQDFAHTATDDITRTRILMSCEAEVLDDEIVSLQARIAQRRRMRSAVEARLRGLAIVVRKR